MSPATTKTREPGAAQGMVLIAQAWVSVVAAMVLAPVLPQIARVFAGAPDLGVKIALVATGPALLVALLSVPFGALADKVGRRILLLIALLLYGAAGTLPIWLPSLDQIVVTRLALGLAEAAIMTCSTALIIDYFHGERRSRWLAAQTGAAPVAAVVCSLLGAALGGLGWRGPFGAYALGFVLFPLVLLLIWEPARMASAPTAGDAGQPPFNWTKPLMIAGVAMFSMILFMVPTIQFSFLATERGLTAAPIIGLWTAVSTVGTPIGAIVFNLVRSRTSTKLMIAYLTYAIGFGLMGLVPTLQAAIIGGFITNFAGGFILPTAITWLLNDMPPHLRGRGSGLWTTANFLGQFLSPLVIYFVSKAVGGLSGAVTVCGAASLVAALIAAFAMTRGAAPQVAREAAE